jgi:hypothetical protein
MALPNEPGPPKLELTVQDQLRLHLEEYGQKEIPVTIEQLSTRLGLPKNSVYQALHRLRQYGEISIEKDTAGDKERITGVKLIKLQPSNRTYKRAAARSGKIIRFNPSQIPSENRKVVDGVPVLEATTAYLNKKLAVERMREQAQTAGLDPTVIQFTPEPIAEEAIMLFKLYHELKTAYDELNQNYKLQGFDLQAEKRNNEVLKRKLREETIAELRGMAN